MDTPSRKSPPLILWWILWVALSTSIVIIYFVLQPPPPKVDTTGVQFLPLIPFVFSALMRWLVLPRFSDGARAFPLFIVGLAMAEGCTILGAILTPALKQHYFALGLVGVAQYFPVFASKYKTA